MDYTKLGNTDIEISKICVGCMSFGKAGIMHDWTLDEEQTAEENSPLTKNTVPFVHQKNQKLFAPGSHFIYLQNHTQKCFCFFPSESFYPDCLEEVLLASLLPHAFCFANVCPQTVCVPECKHSSFTAVFVQPLLSFLVKPSTY